MLSLKLSLVWRSRDDDLGCLEDLVVDCIDALPLATAAVACVSQVSYPEVAKVASMLRVSAQVPTDRAFARQLKRKFVD